MTRQRHVLLIEDDADSAESLSMLLALKGHEVAVAGTGTTGLELARSLRPDIVFCDINLPGEVNGLGVARTLRAETKGVPRLVALTGQSGALERERALQAGFDEHLVKPVRFEDVERLVQSAPMVGRT